MVRVHEPEVALLDEVEEGETRGLILLGDRHHQSEVGLHELPLGLFALASDATQFALAGGGDCFAAGVELLDRLLARLDRLGQTDLVVLGEQGVLTDIGQIQPDEVFIISVDTIFGHSDSLFEVWLTDETSPETGVTIPRIRA